jgi:hypothetical protein
MTVKEIQLAGRLLKLAADIFSNHGCNDMEPNIWGNFTVEDRKRLVREYFEDNNEPEEAAEGHDDLEDYCVMYFLAKKLKNWKEQ